MLALNRQLLLRVLWYYLGLFIMSLGYAFIIRPAVGAAPWDIFHIGVHQQLGVPLSLVIQLTGLAIVLLNMTLGIRPTVGMVLNMLSVGPLMTYLLDLTPLPELVVLRWAMLAAGIFLAGFGTAWYVSADLGSGPRDGMMIGLARKFGGQVGLIKNGIDITVALVGWWLGGPLAAGTVVVALGMGPSVQFGMKLVARLAGAQVLQGFVRPVSLKRS